MKKIGYIKYWWSIGLVVNSCDRIGCPFSWLSLAASSYCLDVQASETVIFGLSQSQNKTRSSIRVTVGFNPREMNDFLLKISNLMVNSR